MENNQNVLNFNSSLYRVKVNSYGDEVVLNTADARIFEKFAMLYDNLQSLADRAQANMRAVNEKYGDDTSNTDAIKDYAREYVAFSRDALKSFDEMFGDGFSRKVFRENYEIDEDFVPDETAITELVEALLPIMEDAYGKRIKRNRQKYSASKKGKHTKSKDELIREYRDGTNE